MGTSGCVSKKVRQAPFCPPPEQSGVFLLFHFHLDQYIHFRGIFQGEFADHRGEKSIDDHNLGSFVVDAAALEVEERLFGDLAGGCLVGNGRIGGAYADIRVGIIFGESIEDEPIALDLGDCAVCPRPDIEEAAIGSAPASLGE